MVGIEKFVIVGVVGGGVVEIKNCLSENMFCWLLVMLTKGETGGENILVILKSSTLVRKLLVLPEPKLKPNAVVRLELFTVPKLSKALPLFAFPFKYNISSTCTMSLESK